MRKLSKRWCDEYRLHSRPTAGVCTFFSRQKVPGRLSSSREELLVNDVFSRVHYIIALGIKAWSGCANECLRSHFSGEILSSSCEELGDFLLQPYREMARHTDSTVVPRQGFALFFALKKRRRFENCRNGVMTNTDSTVAPRQGFAIFFAPKKGRRFCPGLRSSSEDPPVNLIFLREYTYFRTTL